MLLNKLLFTSSQQLAVGSRQLAVGSRQLAVGSWQLAVFQYYKPVKLQMFTYPTTTRVKLFKNVQCSLFSVHCSKMFN